jgi:hypothetical protein
MTGSNGCDELCARCLVRGEPSPFGEAAPRARDDESRRGEQVMFAQHEVGGKVARCPPIEQRRSLWAELIHQIAQRRPLGGVEEHSGHVDRA